MKKGKVFGKTQVIAVLMAVCLGGAIWINMKYSSSSKYLGEATYVGSEKSNAVKTSASVSKEEDYFETAQKKREETVEDIEETVKETLKSDKLTEEDKIEVTTLVKELVSRKQGEEKTETLLLAKGFKKALVVISDKDVNVVVKSEGLTTAQTMQIQDIVTEQTGKNLANIKIVTVK